MPLVAFGALNPMNSFADGLALVHRWTGARGTSFLHATSFWREEWRRATLDGRLERYSVSLNPIGYATEGTRSNLAAEAKPASRVRWYLGRISLAVQAFEAETNC